MIIKSERALDYESSFLSQITSKHRAHLKGCLELRGVIYYSSKRPDLSVELLQDLLEKAGVIENDRQIHFVDIAKAYDKKNPRLEVIIEEIDYESKLRDFIQKSRLPA